MYQYIGSASTSEHRFYPQNLFFQVHDDVHEEEEEEDDDVGNNDVGYGKK